ncbi:serine/threonine protein kinase [Brevibacillus fulvus]|nr:protein kinase [Brevibacillus fulvus]
MSSKLAIPELPKQICGKWYKKVYSIHKRIGQGANGVVYLAESAGQKLALKVGQEPLDMLMEVNMLKAVQQNAAEKIGPRLCDVDDIQLDGQTYTFYVMEFLQGEQLDKYIAQAGEEWVPILVLQLLNRLQILHEQGWIFGDLKPENMIVTYQDKQIRLIDFGGVTKIGNAVRQFTEDYDRATWQAGDRRAEIAYDLFSLAMVMIRLLLKPAEWKDLRVQTHEIQELCAIILNNERLYPYRIPLVRALHGKYDSADAMRQEMLASLQNRKKDQTARSHVRHQHGGDSAEKWIGGIFVASLLLLAGSLYYAWL